MEIQGDKITNNLNDYTVRVSLSRIRVFLLWKNQVFEYILIEDLQDITKANK